MCDSEILSFLIKQYLFEVGFPSVCYKYHWLIKE